MTKWKIILINIMLAIITISVVVFMFLMTTGICVFDSTEFISLSVILGSLVSGFFYELRLLHEKDGEYKKQH